MFNLERRGFDPQPPERRTEADRNPTLLVSWWATIFSLVIILLRVFGRYIRTQKLFREDKIMAFSIIPLLIRMGLVHVVLVFGTNNTTVVGVGPEEAHRRSIGSKAVLASRIFYAMFIWTAKFTVSEFLKRLTSTTWNRTYEIVLKVIRGFLVVTFIGVVIATLAECQPFDHYWQVIPDPGPSCRNGYAQLLTMGITDIITDVALIVFPMPVILGSNMRIKRKISLCILFALSIVLIAITSYRIYNVIHWRGLQQRRTLWASIEILAASAVANSLIIGSFVRDRGVKKAKYKADTNPRIDSIDQPSINRTITKQHWGNDSDEDLFRSVNGRLDSVAEAGANEPTPRRAGVVDPVVNTSKSNHVRNGENGALLSTGTYKRKPSSNSNLNISTTYNDEEAGETTADGGQGRHESQQMTFFDVGGILENGNDPQALYRVTTPSDSIVAQDFAMVNRRGPASLTPSSQSRRSVSPGARRPSQVPVSTEETEEESLQSDDGVHDRTRQRRDPLLNPRYRHLSSANANGRAAPSGPQVELNDAGGLLS